MRLPRRLLADEAWSLGGSRYYPGMEKMPGMHGRGGPMGMHRGEDWVVRGSHVEPFEIEAQMIDKKIFVPIETPIYTGDIMERADPRGGVIEYEVIEVIHHKVTIMANRDYAEVAVREKGHAARTYGSVHLTVSGGTNQFAINSDSASMSQVSSPEAGHLVDLLSQILFSAPAEIDGEARQELAEAVEEAKKTLHAKDSKPNAVKRALRAVRGLVEDLGDSIGDGASEGVKAWVKTSVVAFGAYLGRGGA